MPYAEKPILWAQAFDECPDAHWRLPQLKSMHRGEIVAFRYPRDPSQIFLKRVAAVGGDRVAIRSGVLFVNDEPVQETYALHSQLLTLAGHFEQMPPRIVPRDELFMLGDNRDNSSDSRAWGTVPVKNVIGSPVFIFWSYDAPTAAWLDVRPASRLHFYTSIALHLFSRTRWSRMGMVF